MVMVMITGPIAVSGVVKLGHSPSNVTVSAETVISPSISAVLHQIVNVELNEVEEDLIASGQVVVVLVDGAAEAGQPGGGENQQHDDDCHQKKN
ncbi:hypothetical protein TYRP_007721 [Tyrophagus putrescentiae]|nr:hypothetical protein TYRP_007721 [Tyrophagus putrescentiae]